MLSLYSPSDTLLHGMIYYFNRTSHIFIQAKHLSLNMSVKIDNTTPEAAQSSSGNKFKIRIPISVKLALAITLLIVSGMATLGFIILENQKIVLTQQANDMGSTIAHQFANSAAEMVLSDDSLGLQTLTSNLLDSQQVKGAIIASEKGAPLASKGTYPALPIIKQRINTSLKSKSSSFEWSSTPTPDEIYLAYSSPIKFKQLTAGYVFITLSKQNMIRSLNNLRFVIIMITAFMSLIAIFLAFVMSKHLSQPIYNLVDASKAIDDGNYKFRLNERRNDEIGELAHAFNHMAHGLFQKSQVEDAFSRYVSSNVAQKVLQNLDEVELGGIHVNASVLFADIVGFTSISEKMPPDEIANLLNEYFTQISNIAQLHNGHIDKFMGDCAMAVFGVPEVTSDHSYNAVSCAISIQEKVKQLNQQRLKEKKIPVHFRIGVNTGVMVAGNLGSNDRMEYTVIGDPVNLASRLAGIAKSDQIIVLEEFYRQDNIEQRIEATQHKVIRVRGIEDEVSTWLVQGIKNTPHANTDVENTL